ncbi:DUF6726 family protein [Nitrospirillum iridis]|uniref:Phosphoribosylglycinamide formyltransferase n=1 Tax=Nitrospirillum iridis TaxID=765888 RepID=A0A7X0AYR6_9PROT|nr:DUF6726 family protein [Nitrospirillum iridis]MBB6252607.1 hypothetical protein [Nitrospirillum iridis]
MTIRRPHKLPFALLMLTLAAGLSGCSGLIALPVRTASAVVKVVPVAGNVVAAPLDVAADAID